MARGIIKIAALTGAAKQARDYARKNPEKVSSTISKLEDVVSRKVGSKYAAHVGKGGNAVRSGLGISATGRGTSQTPLTRPQEDVTPPPSSLPTD